MPGDELSGGSVVVLAASLSFPVIGLDHFLRTSPAQFYAQPETEISHWFADSMMALPLFVIGVLAWLLHQAAERAYASRVYQTKALLPVPPRPHAVHSSPPRPSAAGPSATAAPYSFFYQAAHALQDGLAGQAAGLPVAITVLLIGGAALRVRPPAGQPPPTQLSATQPPATQLSGTQQEDS